MEDQMSLLEGPRIRPESLPAEPSAPSSEPMTPYLFVKWVEILIGDEMDTALFGKVRINVLYDSEEEARADGYETDTHMKGGAWPYAGWKILANVDRGSYAAVRLKTGG